MLHRKRSYLVMLLYITLLFLSLPAGKPDLSADRAALLTLRSAVGGRTHSWNASFSSPCKWSGVTCENNRVTALRLPAFSLAGQIPDGTFGNLTQLRTLSLRFNSLSGSLPSDLAACTELRNLYLQDNSFSGDLPDSLFSLLRLIRLNLAGNELSGGISSGFNNLTRLRTLYLDRNQFSGSIPDLILPSIVQFNVSSNQLNGSIPKSLQAMPVAAFTGNSLCGKPLDSCPGDVASAPIIISPGKVNRKKTLPGGAIAGIVIGSVLGFLLILLFLCILCRKKKGRKSSSVEVAAIKHLDNEISEEKPIVAAYTNGTTGNGYLVPPAAAASAVTARNTNPKSESGGAKKLVFFGDSARVFDIEDLLRASAEVLGKGMSGTTYKAVLEMGPAVVVKRLKDVIVSENEFREKIEFVGALIHQNLVPLKAYYFSRDEKLLVYDYMSMGSLSALLHGNRGAGRTPLNWETRCKIAVGAARGIEYIHSQNPNASHGNVRSSNILLSKTHEPHLSDFGLSQLVGPSINPSRAAGYRAPEVTDSRKVSQKADVYSFGVLLLELLTGKAPLANDEGVDLPRWVQSVVRDEWTNEVFDVELLRNQNVEEDMVQLLQLGIDCADQYPDRRPTMVDVTKCIDEIYRTVDGKRNLDHNNINED